MATKRTAKKKSNAPVGYLIGIFLIILLSGILILNKSSIEKTLKNTKVLDQLKPETKVTETISQQKPEQKIEQQPVQKPDQQPEQKQEPSPLQKPEQKPEATNKPQTTTTTVPQTTPVKTPETTGTTQKNTESQTKPVNTPQTVSQPKQTQPAAAPTEKVPQSKDRTLYFMQLAEDGSLVRAKVSRAIKVSDSPLYDVIQSLLAGPTETEKKRGLISVIPPNSRLLSATVKDGIAYLNFNDAFQFNTYGVEGYTAQLKQIVWTATEFTTVQGIQILIEGKSPVYLGGEGIRIDKPLTRDSF
ncbi:MAG: GerMN domain-containing protein [Spirochaetota bacterium]